MMRGRYISSMDDISAVYRIREALGIEADDDDKMSIYALVYDEEDRPVGSGRLYIDEDSRFTIGGLCVLKEARRKGYGDLMMRMLLTRAESLNAAAVYLSAPAEWSDYYRRYGFVEYGEPYQDGCVRMRVSAGEMRIGGSCNETP